MNNQESGNRPDLKALFSDTTEDYLIPAEPDLHDHVTLRLRTGRDQAEVCFAVVEGAHLRMHLSESDESFDYYSVRFEITKSPLRYYFEVIAGGRRYRYTRRGIRNTIRRADYWHVVPGFHLPAWAVGAVMYQIFVDRFCNGDRSNDVYDGEYTYMGRPVIAVRDWDQPPSPIGYCEFYGGDLQGVMDKLDYLQELGVEAIYLNPVFLSPSSHKYDTQDYEHIDPHFGRIVKDHKKKKGGRKGDLPARHAGRPPAFRNCRADRYLERVTDPANLEASDRLFARLVRAAHERGIRVILDGVFNHCGSFHRWLDAEKIYEQLPDGFKGARASKRSPFVEYFKFDRDDWPSNDSYDSWWDFGTLPKLHYEQSEKLCNYILRIAKKWVSPPYCADGWRLDVAADLSYSKEFNHRFWKRFRKAVKEANPEAVIIAENYVDSWKWLQGDEWDTIMNYEFFMEPVTWFLTGMEKHSDGRDEERYGDPDTFWKAVLGTGQEALPGNILRISMNQLSNHDHSRFLTRTNRVVGRAEDLGIDAAMENVSMEVMRQAVLLQMTWTGAPTIYYGDEAGVGGFTDPDNRRTYPWGHEDRTLLRCHKALANLRKNSPALRRGSLLRLPDTDGVLAYARFHGSGKDRESWIVIININHIEIDYTARVTYAGIPPEAELKVLFFTGRETCLTPAPAEAGPGSASEPSGKPSGEARAAETAGAAPGTGASEKTGQIKNTEMEEGAERPGPVGDPRPAAGPDYAGTDGSAAAIGHAEKAGPFAAIGHAENTGLFGAMDHAENAGALAAVDAAEAAGLTAAAGHTDYADPAAESDHAGAAGPAADTDFSENPEPGEGEKGTLDSLSTVYIYAGSMRLLLPPESGLLLHWKADADS